MSLHWRVLLPLYLLLSVTTKTIIELLNQAFVFPMEKLYTFNQQQHLVKCFAAKNYVKRWRKTRLYCFHSFLSD